MAVAFVALLANAAHAAPACFQRGDTANAPFAIFQIAKPPKFVAAEDDFEQSSPFYPGTSFATTSLDVLSVPEPLTRPRARFKRYYLHWVNRCIFVPGTTPTHDACRNVLRSKGNNYVGMPKVPFAEQVRPLFSTYARADSCTRAQVAHALRQASPDVDREAIASGLTLIEDGRDQAKIQSMARSVATPDGRQQTALLDVCVLAPDVLAPDVAGIVLDYEVFDERTPDEVIGLFSSLHTLTKQAGKELIANTNPLPRKPNGLVGGSIRAVMRELDGFAPTLASGASMGNTDIGLRAQERKMSPWDSYVDQLSLLTNDGRSPLSPAERAKLIWNVSLFDMRLSEAKQIHDEFIAQHYGGIVLARAYVKPGGSCSRPENQVIACLALGQCDSQFGTNR